MAVNIDDLWIGDYVRSISLNAVGRFEGQAAPDMARVRMKERLVLLPAADLVKVDELPRDEAMETPDEMPESPGIRDMTDFERTIDLHMEVLDPSRQHDPPYEILRYQLNKCRAFLDSAVRHRADRVKIIHGIGEGVLRREVEAILQAHSAVYHHLSANRGGAYEVWLRW